MIKHHIEIPLPQPVKPVALQKLCQANISDKYVVDEMATDAGCSVLRSPVYHYISNPNIKMVWNQLKSHANIMSIIKTFAIVNFTVV